MDDSKQKNPANEDSVSLYMSFADDTMMSTNTAYNTIESVNELSMDDVMADLLSEANKTLEADGTEADKVNVNDHLSPLRAFDKNLLNQFNGKCSTPSKDQINKMKNGTPSRVKELEVLYLKPCADGNKENTRPYFFGDGTQLSVSSMADNATSKTLTSTTDDESCPDDMKDNVKNQSDTKKKSPSKVNTLKDFSDLEAEFNDKISKSKVTFNPKTSDIEHKKNPDDIKSLIDEMLKVTTGKEKNHKTQKAAATSCVQLRSSLLPTAGGEKRAYGGGLKQRMSVVKTTLNSPARKMSSKGSALNHRKSVIPPVKTATYGYRQSMLPTTKPPMSGVFDTNRKIPQSSTISNEEASKAKLTASYTCATCGVAFRVKSLLNAHKRSHELDDNPPGFVKKTLSNNSNSGSNQQPNLTNQCKYCDKKFALQRALHIHLMQNCTKIPPSEQRKLEYTELDHVEKAQLPVFPCTTAGLDALGNVAEKDLIDYSDEKTRMDPILEVPKTKMLPPQPISSAKKSRQKAAAPHAGVIRTPTKSVPCHICKQSFKSILDYTNHSLTMHSTNPKTMLAKHNEAPSAVNLVKK